MGAFTHFVAVYLHRLIYRLQRSPPGQLNTVGGGWGGWIPSRPYRRHDTLAIYCLIYSLPWQTAACFYLWNKAASVIPQLTLATVSSLTLRCCSSTPGTHLDKIPDNTALIVTSLSNMYPESLTHRTPLTLTCSQGHAPPSPPETYGLKIELLYVKMRSEEGSREAWRREGLLASVPVPL